MTKLEIMCKEFEMMYIDRTKRGMSHIYFKQLTPEKQQALALGVTRFAIEKYLRWRPQDVARYMTREVLVKLRLMALIEKYVQFPVEYSKEYELTYLCYLLYPEIYHLDMETQCMHMYEKIMSGERDKIPAEWSESMEEGTLRFQIILCYVISGLRYKNKEALYRDFAGPNGLKILKKYKIDKFALRLFPDVFSAFHYSMPEEIRDDFLFTYLRFEALRKKQLPKKKKGKRSL